MQITVRANGPLAQSLGVPRLYLSLPDDATIEHLLTTLREQHPDSAEILELAVPIIAGQHQSSTTTLKAGQEVALLIPVAGG